MPALDPKDTEITIEVSFRTDEGDEVRRGYFSAIDDDWYSLEGGCSHHNKKVTHWQPIKSEEE